MDIRRATTADLDAMRALWEASEAEASYKPYPGTEFADSLLTEHVALLAEHEGTALGTAYVNIAAPDFGFVFGVYVVRGARRRGVARALMQEVARVLHQHGRRFVLLNVDTPNHTARAVYERLGFEDAARTLRIEVGKLLG